jgi:acid stress-induced BolA-like protein IbaG/YrbA
MNEEEIRNLLVDGLDGCDTELTVDGSHLALRLVSNAFAGLNRVKRQQLVYSLLNEKISSGEIHAVTMTCLSLDEIQD